MSTEFTDSGRVINTRIVKEDRIADLLPYLYERGLSEDDVYIDPIEGNGTPDAIIAICKATKSILIFGDGRLTCVQGTDKSSKDSHYVMFDALTEKWEPYD